MTSRQFKTEKFEEFKTELQEYARSKPYCPIYETDVRLNDEKYTLFIQPDRNNRMYISYALWVGADKETGAAAYEMITKGAILSSLMEMIVYQGLAKQSV